MDTITYASVAVLPWSVGQTNTHPIVPEAEFPSLVWSHISPTEVTKDRDPRARSFENLQRPKDERTQSIAIVRGVAS